MYIYLSRNIESRNRQLIKVELKAWNEGAEEQERKQPWDLVWKPLPLLYSSPSAIKAKLLKITGRKHFPGKCVFIVAFMGGKKSYLNWNKVSIIKERRAEKRERTDNAGNALKVLRHACCRVERKRRFFCTSLCFCLETTRSENTEVLKKMILSKSWNGGNCRNTKISCHVRQFAD